MNYTLNVPLLRKLPELSPLGITKTLEVVRIDYATWNRRTSDKQVNSYFSSPSVEEVLRLCNVMRVPVHYLFTAEGEPDIVPATQELCLPADSFKPYSFDWKLFRAYFGRDGKLKKSAAEIMRMMCMSKKPYFSWFEDHETLHIPALLLFCRTFEVDLFSLIIDPNKPATNSNNAANEKSNNLPVEEQLQKKLEQLKKQLDASKKKSRELQKENEALKSDNIRLTGELMEAKHENTLLRKQMRNEGKLYNLDLDEPSKLIAADDIHVGYGNKNEDKDLV